MKTTSWLAALTLLASIATASAADAPESWDGLIQVKPKRMDAAYLLPGADFRPYTRVMVDPTQVAFQKDWLKRINQDRRPSDRVDDEQAQKILAAARSNFDDVFTEAFTKAGFTIVTTPAADVLRVSTAVINLYINAPDTMSAGRSYTFTAEAGEATLVIEVRDSLSGALMGRVLDRRETQGGAGMQMATRVTNQAEFRALFRQWAGTAVKGLDELKAHSPVPTDLRPGQKLQD
ncbi:MAG: DUF3313 domain-containing protein [Steroidobacteraceae bacterium]|nr:DUF3313 domain-containing protein [Steroidobacteraceae bacterium]